MTIAVELENGSRYEYDSMDGSIRRLRDRGIDIDEELLTKELGYNLRKLIPLTGKTQKDISDEVGISNVMMSRYIHGGSSPSAAKLHMIARALGCTMDELFDSTYME